MVSVMSESRYQSGSSMHIQGLIPQKLAEAVPIDLELSINELT